MKPLCFVLMPFGTKPDATGTLIDFDAVYRDLIGPAVAAADLDPIRADEEMVDGIIHKPMYERLLMCPYAVADLTTANANVFYELGVRHATKPWSTVLMYADSGRLPFDVAPLRALPYQLDANGKPVKGSPAQDALVAKLRAAREPSTDSPIFQLIDGMPVLQLDHEKTDVFRQQVQYSTTAKERLAEARSLKTVDAVDAVAQSLRTIRDLESGVVIDIFLSYRAVKAWGKMIALVADMPPPLAQTIMVQEQLALALNRDQQGEKAERVLLDLLKRRGPSSETYGILGRVYKDRWDTAVKSGKEMLARGLLDKAIDAYRLGFEADWRDAYPGVNAVTLMEIREPPDERRLQLLPLVTYAVQRKVAKGQPDYWDHATLLELAVLAKDQDAANKALADALAAVREKWEPETTANNLRLIRQARGKRGENLTWLTEVEDLLLGAAV